MSPPKDLLPKTYLKLTMFIYSTQTPHISNSDTNPFLRPLKYKALQELSSLFSNVQAAYPTTDNPLKFKCAIQIELLGISPFDDLPIVLEKPDHCALILNAIRKEAFAQLSLLPQKSKETIMIAAGLSSKSDKIEEMETTFLIEQLKEYALAQKLNERQQREEVQDQWIGQKRRKELESSDAARDNLKRFTKWILIQKQYGLFNPLEQLTSDDIFQLCLEPIKGFRTLFKEKTNCGVGVSAFTCYGHKCAAKEGLLQGDWKIGRHLNHPNFIRSFCYFKQHGSHDVLLMELVDGKNLYQSELPKPSFPSIIKQAVAALSYLLDNRITPSDIHCNNIMITVEGDLKLIDYATYLPKLIPTKFAKEACGLITELTSYMTYSEPDLEDRLLAFDNEIKLNLLPLDQADTIRSYLNEISSLFDRYFESVG